MNDENNTVVNGNEVVENSDAGSETSDVSSEIKNEPVEKENTYTPHPDSLHSEIQTDANEPSSTS